MSEKLPMAVTFLANPDDDAGALLDWPEKMSETARKLSRVLVGAALARPGFAVPVPIKDHHLVCIVADVSGKGGAVRGSLKLFGEMGHLDVVVGHGEGAPGVVDRPEHRRGDRPDSGEFVAGAAGVRGRGG